MRFPLAAALTLTLAAAARGDRPSTLRAIDVALSVDARDAPRRLLHAHLTVPARAGPLTLLYPRWIPGEHGPTGPIANLVGLKFTASGRPIPWRRDPLDLYRFHCEVPPGADSVDVQIDYAASSSREGFTSGASMTGQLAVVNWNQVLLYPAELRPAELRYHVTIELPTGWSAATALAASSDGGGDRLAFAPIDLPGLIDSPLLAGRWLRRVQLADGHELDLAADDPSALDVPHDWIAGLDGLVRESRALFGAPPYRGYHFLLALSDGVSHFGLEHHDSSDDRMPERALADDGLRAYWTRLLPHELVHAWNGKYRRPSSQIAADYQQPRSTDLLWVYEGLTAYLGDLLTVRSGLWPDELLRGRLAEMTSALQTGPGRSWRSLEDTALAARAVYDQPAGWATLRRSADFHSEGELLWLEVDAIIRQRSQGRRSLDDFCRRFFSGGGGEAVRGYTFDGLVDALDGICPYEWRHFFARRVEAAGAPAPEEALERAGWAIAAGGRPNPWRALLDRLDGGLELSASLGLKLDADGEVLDVVPGSPADRAHLTTGARLAAIGGRRFTIERMASALRRCAGTDELELLTEHDEWFETQRLACGAGIRYPSLAPSPGRADLLSAILAPHDPRRR